MLDVGGDVGWPKAELLAQADDRGSPCDVDHVQSDGAYWKAVKRHVR